MEHEFFFRGLERQRLIYSILQAPPSEHGAGIDLASLLAGGRWRLASSDASDAADADALDGRNDHGRRDGASPTGQQRAAEERERASERTFQAMLTLTLTVTLALTLTLTLALTLTLTLTLPLPLILTLTLTLTRCACSAGCARASSCACRASTKPEQEATIAAWAPG